MTEQEKFVRQIISDRNYWLSQSDKLSIEEVVDGVLFSLLVMIDGDSSTNDFHPLTITDTVNGARIDGGYLHDLFCLELREGKT